MNEASPLFARKGTLTPRRVLGPLPGGGADAVLHLLQEAPILKARHVSLHLQLPLTAQSTSSAWGDAAKQFGALKSQICDGEMGPKLHGFPSAPSGTGIVTTSSFALTSAMILRSGPRKTLHGEQ